MYFSILTLISLPLLALASPIATADTPSLAPDAVPTSTWELTEKELPYHPKMAESRIVGRSSDRRCPDTIWVEWKEPKYNVTSGRYEFRWYRGPYAHPAWNRQWCDANPDKCPLRWEGPK
jgi:hypothetical protein